MSGWGGDDRHGENGLLTFALATVGVVDRVAARRVLERCGALDLAEMIGV